MMASVSGVGVAQADHVARRLLDVQPVSVSGAAAAPQIRDADVLKVIELLLQSKPRQDRFGANPPGKKHVVGSTLGAVGYSGKVFLKKGSLAWGKTRNVVRLLNAWRDQRTGIKCEADDVVRPTTIQVNLNMMDSPGVALHIDGNNYGLSEIVLLGQFSGGGFFLEDLNCSSPVERELVCSSGKVASAKTRTPGIYKGRVWEPACGTFKQFDGSLQLHRGEPVSNGIRISLVWFSINERYLRSMTAEVHTELTSSGFRPRRVPELTGSPAISNPLHLSNDSGTYPPGFLYFARQHREQIELELCRQGEMKPGEATNRLRSRWESLRDGDALEEKGYFAALERIERSPKYKKRRGEVDEVEEDGDDIVEIVELQPSPQRAGPVTVSGPCNHWQEGVAGVSGPLQPRPSPNNCEANEQDIELRSLAEIIIDEYPRALQDTDLFINVLNQFGIADNQYIRSRALELVNEKKEEALARTLAKKIKAAEERGEPESCIRFLRSSSRTSDEDSQEAVFPSSPKRPRLSNAFTPMADSSTSSASATNIFGPWDRAVEVVEDSQSPEKMLSLTGTSSSIAASSASPPEHTVSTTVIEVLDSQDLEDSSSHANAVEEQVKSVDLDREKLLVIKRLESLGFDRERAKEAANRFSSVEAAIDWCLSNKSEEQGTATRKKYLTLN